MESIPIGRCTCDKAHSTTGLVQVQVGVVIFYYHCRVPPGQRNEKIVSLYEASITKRVNAVQHEYGAVQCATNNFSKLQGLFGCDLFLPFDHPLASVCASVSEIGTESTTSLFAKILDSVGR